VTAPNIHPGTPAEEAVRGILLALLATMESNVPGALLGRDPEFLHDLRVAARRSRCALTRIKGVFPARSIRRFERDLRWIGVRTGPTRDLDVYLVQMSELQATLGGGGEREIAPLLDLLDRRRAREQKKLSRTLASLRLQRFFSDWRRFLEGPPPDPASSDRDTQPIREAARKSGTAKSLGPISVVASEAIAAAYQKALRRGALLETSDSVEAFHKLRIDCKNLRYLMGFFASLYPRKSLRPLVREVKRLQDHLGEINDLAVQRRAMEGLALDFSARERAPAATLMAMGRLIGRLEERQALSMKSFRKDFRRFAGPRNRSRFQELFGPCPSSLPSTTS
jgi:CHAD domain-containing protein